MCKFLNQNDTIELMNKIQKKREKLLFLANKLGHTHCETIICSQELDQLIYQYQRRMMQMKAKGDEKTIFSQFMKKSLHSSTVMLL